MFPEGRIVDFLIVGVVALIVVGPKDLPILMRKVGQFMARMRAMAAEFRASFDELARQSELDELRREVDALRAGATSMTALPGAADVQKVFDEIHSGLRANDTHPGPSMDYQYPARSTPVDAPAPAMMPLNVETSPLDPAEPTVAKVAP